VVRATGPSFLLFVLVLGVVVHGVTRGGRPDWFGTSLPTGDGLPALLALAFGAALLANLVNNLPAVLALLPLVAGHGPGPVLAVLIGVNLGPDLTYVGSLATLLWRRVLAAHRAEPSLADYTRLGAITVPATIVAATVGLWVMLHTVGA
jgi:arsenical pump membrane protein